MARKNEGLPDDEIEPVFLTETVSDTFKNGA